jgi:hypothetical protein
MSDDADEKFDPRFDPAFQRGFDPSIPVTAVRAERPPTAVRSAVIEPALRPNTPTPTIVPRPEIDESDSEPVVELDGDRQGSPIADESSPVGRNPYILALIIIAVVLVIAGLWLFAQSGAAFNSREVRSQGDYMSLDAAIHAAPFIAILGGATAIGVLFVFASRWRHRR